MLTLATFAALVDHTALKAETTPEQVQQLCKEAKEHGFASVCVNGSFISQVEKSGVTACSVVGFPLGACSIEALLGETEAALDDGAKEIDMVIPLGRFKAGDIDATAQTIRSIRSTTNADTTLKVILETAALSDEEIVTATKIALDQGADFIKTSTGFHPSGGASLKAVELMAKTADGAAGIKASGGIRSLQDAQLMVNAGATRLGMSSAMAVIAELNA